MSTTTHTDERSTVPDHHADPLGDIPREDDCGLCGGTGAYHDPVADEHVTCWACIDYAALNERLGTAQEARE